MDKISNGRFQVALGQFLTLSTYHKHEIIQTGRLYALRLRVNAMFTCSKPWRRQALLVLRRPAKRDAGGCGMLVSGSGIIER